MCNKFDYTTHNNWLKYAATILIAFVYIISAIYTNNLQYGKTPIKQDPAGYYCYLPSVFIYHNLNSGYLFWKHEFARNYYKEYGYQPERWFLYHGKNGRWVIKFSCGVALCELPFFLTACLCSKICGFPIDGYSFFFKLFFIICNLTFSFLGLYALYKLLKSYFKEQIAIITIIITALCTNYYYYSCIVIGMSHIFNFFFATVLLHNWLSFLKEQTIKKFCISSFCMGMIVLIRPTDCVYGIFLFMLLALDKKLPIFITFLKSCRIKVLYFVACFFSPLLVQMIFWKFAAGTFVFYSYANEGFDFLHPHILDGLLSIKKGWLIYTPIMIFALAGLKLCRKNYSIALLIALAIHCWIVFSWWSWWYGGSFGCRVMILFYPALAIPMAKLLGKVKTKFAIFAVGFIIAFFSYWNVLQSYQVQKGILHYENTDWELYKKSLFRIK
mgnify:FL=1